MGKRCNSKVVQPCMPAAEIQMDTHLQPTLRLAPVRRSKSKANARAKSILTTAGSLPSAATRMIDRGDKVLVALDRCSCQATPAATLGGALVEKGLLCCFTAAANRTSLADVPALASPPRRSKALAWLPEAFALALPSGRWLAFAAPLGLLSQRGPSIETASYA